MPTPPPPRAGLVAPAVAPYVSNPIAEHARAATSVSQLQAQPPQAAATVASLFQMLPVRSSSELATKLDGPGEEGAGRHTPPASLLCPPVGGEVAIGYEYDPAGGGMSHVSSVLSLGGLAVGGEAGGEEGSSMGGKLHACKRCQRAKTACNNARPCARCVRLNVPCDDSLRAVKRACVTCRRSKVLFAATPHPYLPPPIHIPRGDTWRMRPPLGDTWQVKCDLDDRYPNPCTRCTHLHFDCQPHVPNATPSAKPPAGGTASSRKVCGRQPSQTAKQARPPSQIGKPDWQARLASQHTSHSFLHPCTHPEHKPSMSMLPLTLHACRPCSLVQRHLPPSVIEISGDDIAATAAAFRAMADAAPYTLPESSTAHPSSMPVMPVMPMAHRGEIEGHVAVALAMVGVPAAAPDTEGPRTPPMPTVAAVRAKVAKVVVLDGVAVLDGASAREDTPV